MDYKKLLLIALSAYAFDGLSNEIIAAQKPAAAPSASKTKFTKDQLTEEEDPTADPGEAQARVDQAKELLNQKKQELAELKAEVVRREKEITAEVAAATKEVTDATNMAANERAEKLKQKIQKHTENIQRLTQALVDKKAEQAAEIKALEDEKSLAEAKRQARQAELSQGGKKDKGATASNKVTPQGGSVNTASAIVSGPQPNGAPQSGIGGLLGGLGKLNSIVDSVEKKVADTSNLVASTSDTFANTVDQATGTLVRVQDSAAAVKGSISDLLPTVDTARGNVVRNSIIISHKNKTMNFNNI